jgi:large subunit ribosomal protein L25
MGIMDKVVLHATNRIVKGKQVSALRREGKLPAVIYGRHITTTSLLLDLRETTKALHGLTSSSLVTIDLEGQEFAALVREKQRDFIKGNYIHLDFQAVSLTEKIRTTVNIEVTGLSPAVKDFNGVIVTGMEKIEVECLPQYLPERIVVDISSLLKIGDVIHLKDVTLDENVKILEDLDQMLVLVTAPKEEVVEEVVAEVGVAGTEPEVIEKGKKEEEEGAEK